MAGGQPSPSRALTSPPARTRLAVGQGLGHTAVMLRIRPVPGNRQRLDGGAMFGNVPKALWRRWCDSDERGRIELAGRALLVEDGRHRILLETGTGFFFEPKLRERYGVSGEANQLLESLSALSLGDADIDIVILSHLHFDHVGGLLTDYRPDVPSQLLFPNARYLVTRDAFERAIRPHPRDRASFVPEVPGLLQDSGRLVLIDGTQRPDDLLDERYRFRVFEGHTPGMLLTEVTGQAARVVCCGDLVPGTPWLHVPVTMGYDRYAERAVNEKGEFLATAVDQDWLLFFTHDPVVALTRIERSPEGRYAAVGSLGDDCTGLDLDQAP